MNKLKIEQKEEGRGEGGGGSELVSYFKFSPRREALIRGFTISWGITNLVIN